MYFTSSLVQRLGKDGRSLLMQTTSLMSSYEGSVGTNSWYGNWYSSSIPNMKRFRNNFISFFKLAPKHWTFSKSILHTHEKKYFGFLFYFSMEMLQDAWGCSSIFMARNAKCVGTSWDTTPSDLPENEPKAVHVGHDVRLKMTSVQSLIQNLWRHIALCTDSSVGRDVYLIGVTAKSEIKVVLLN